MTKYVVLDTSAVLELARDGSRAAKIEEHIGTKTVAVSAAVVGEACSVALRQGLNGELLFRELLSRAHVVPLDATIAFNAAQVHASARKQKPKFSYIDAVVVMTADYLQAPLITCDTDFRGMKRAIVVQ